MLSNRPLDLACCHTPNTREHPKRSQTSPVNGQRILLATQCPEHGDPALTCFCRAQVILLLRVWVTLIVSASLLGSYYFLRSYHITEEVHQQASHDSSDTIRASPGWLIFLDAVNPLGTDTDTDTDTDDGEQISEQLRRREAGEVFDVVDPLVGEVLNEVRAVTGDDDVKVRVRWP
jgi:hypothetical protein